MKAQCSVCSKASVARGWCVTHYERWKRTGDPTLVRRQSAKDSAGNPLICYIADCKEVVRNKGLCANHYARLRRHGTTDYIGKPNEGASKHPLYSTFHGMMQRRWVSPEWHDFWRFVADVGERPHYMARLLQPDSASPLGPNNWAWAKRREIKKKDGHWAKRASKVWAGKNAERLHGDMLRFRFGVTKAEYEERLAAQGGLCAICAKTCSKRLAVDHSHHTGAIRGLLCRSCNTALGGFKDDPALLNRAIEYLRGTAPE